MGKVLALMSLMLVTLAPGFMAFAAGGEGRGAQAGRAALTGPDWVWRQEMRTEVLAAPLVVGRTVVLAASDGTVTAFDLETGERRWAQALGGSLTAAPVAAAGRILVGNKDGRMLALATQSGALDWELRVGGRIVTTPVVSQGVAFFGATDMYFYAVNVEDGSIRWRYLAKDYKYGGLFADAMVDAERSYFGGKNGWLYALDRDSGALKWWSELGSSVYDAPLSLGERLIVGSYDRSLYCLRKDNGQQLWKATLDDWPQGTPLLHEGELFVASRSGVLYVIAADSGEVLWQQPVAEGFRHGPVAQDAGHALIGGINGVLYRIDLDKRTVVSMMQMDQPFFAPAVISGRNVLVAGRDGAVLLYR